MKKKENEKKKKEKYRMIYPTASMISDYDNHRLIKTKKIRLGPTWKEHKKIERRNPTLLKPC